MDDNSSSEAKLASIVRNELEEQGLKVDYSEGIGAALVTIAAKAYQVGLIEAAKVLVSEAESLDDLENNIFFELED